MNIELNTKKFEKSDELVDFLLGINNDFKPSISEHSMLKGERESIVDFLNRRYEDDSFIVEARTENELIGVAICYIRELNNEQFIIIDLIGVSKEHRMNGVSDNIYSYLIENSSEYSICFSTWEENEAQKKNARKHGFGMFCTVIGFYGNELDDIEDDEEIDFDKLEMAEYNYYIKSNESHSEDEFQKLVSFMDDAGY